MHCNVHSNAVKKKWMTKETMNVVKEKHKAYKKYINLRTNESKDDYDRAKQKAIKRKQGQILRQGLQTI